jgi:molecular chaperone DnaK
MYADAQAKAQASQGQGAEPQQPGAAGAESGKKDDGNVVDAEFTEVKDKKTGS